MDHAMTSSLPVIECLLEAADRALYQMKCSGGGGVIAPLRFNAGLGGVARRLFKYFSEELDRRLPRPGFRLWMLSSFGCPVADKGKRLERHTLNEKVLCFWHSRAENLDVVLVTALIALNTASAYGAMSDSRSSSDTNLAATMPRPMTDREVRIQQ